MIATAGEDSACFLDGPREALVTPQPREALGALVSARRAAQSAMHAPPLSVAATVAATSTAFSAAPEVTDMSAVSGRSGSDAGRHRCFM